MASALIRIFPQEKLSAAKTFLETKEKSGIDAALAWLAGLEVERESKYLYDEKDFLNIGKEMRPSIRPSLMEEAKPMSEGT
jgi:hypothetical protein